MVYLSILNRLVKHLGALMLPIFAPNIIQALTDYHAFFIRPILLNILWTAIALFYTYDRGEGKTAGARSIRRKYASVCPF
jgi:hypothetical protein